MLRRCFVSAMLAAAAAAGGGGGRRLTSRSDARPTTVVQRRTRGPRYAAETVASGNLSTRYRSETAPRR